MLFGGIAAVLFIDWDPVPPAPPEVVRPVKFAVATDPAALPERRFRGQVLAGRTIELAFQVSGPLIEANLALGRRVAGGDVLARIDATRFEQQIATLRPQLEQAQLRLDRVTRVAESGAATANELTEAKTARDAAAAQLAVAEQAIADTVLRAPVDALIVGRMVENFQNVQAATPVVRLQDITRLDVAVDMPESVVALYKATDEPAQTRVVFPVRPDVSYPVDVKEASGEADNQTGTYRVVYTMPAPQDMTALPGMTATLLVPARKGSDGGRVAVPLEALHVDSRGRRLVWRLEPSGADYRVMANPVDVIDTSGETVIIGQGLAPGTRVATAGVAFLREGQRVTLMESR